MFALKLNLFFPYLLDLPEIGGKTEFPLLVITPANA